MKLITLTKKRKEINSSCNKKPDKYIGRGMNLRKISLQFYCKCRSFFFFAFDFNFAVQIVANKFNER